MRRVFLFLASVMAASTSTAGGASQCPADTVPIQIVGVNWSGPETTLSAAGLSNPFITAVTEHVAARLDKDKLCLHSAESKKRSLIQFVEWHLYTGNSPLALAPSLDARPSGGCRITSPWIDLAIERGPVPWVRGVVRWNHRQLLADQAVLAGARNVPPGVAMPLTQNEFVHFAEAEYTKSEISHKTAAKPIEERIPADLLWLFRRTPCCSDRAGPLFQVAGSAMNRIMEKGAEGYTRLVIALIDRCFDADGAEIHYDSILDAADLIPLEQYKIDMPIRQSRNMTRGEFQ